MDKYPGVEIAPLDGSRDSGEEQRCTLFDFGEEFAHQGIGRSVQPRDGHAAYRPRIACAAYQQRPVAASECRTAVEQHVVFRDGGQHGATYLADVGTSQPGTAVQLLDVVVFDLEAQAARVDAAVNERIEHESVVRAG